MAHEMTSPNPGELDGISEKTNTIHHDKLYAGYVNKRNEIETSLAELDAAGWENANQIYSQLRGLKEGETFAANGMILHEVYFDILGGDGKPSGALYEAILKKWNDWESFVKVFSAIGMAARGWAILAYDPSDKELHIFQADAQNQGGVWGAVPLITLDVYEHAYFIDHGSDRKAYIQAFFKNLNWVKINARFAKVSA